MNWYANNLPAPYAPATFKGGWDKTTGAFDGFLDFNKLGSSSNTNASKSNSENNLAGPFSVCVLRLVSRRLAGQTISGTLDMVMSLIESSSLADLYTKVYAYVTQGDSDGNRGTILDYTEASLGGGTEWPITNSVGRGFASAQALTPVNALDFDRIVIEFGFNAENVSATNFTGSTRVGARNSSVEALNDLTIGSTLTASSAGFFIFSNSPTLHASEPTNVSPETATEILSTPYQVTQDPLNLVTPLWFKKIGDANDNNAISVFGGVSAGSGNYNPRISHLREVAANDYTVFRSNITAKVAIDIVAIGTTYYFYANTSSSVGAASTRGLVFNVRSGPAYTSVSANEGNLLISPDSSNSFGAIIDKDTGEITYIQDIVISETGAVNNDGVVCFDEQLGTNVKIYNPNLNLLTTVTGVKFSITTAAVDTDGTDFFIAAPVSAVLFRLSKVSPTGVILDTWDITTLPGEISPSYLALSPDGSILYYCEAGEFGSAGFGIHRWDLVNDVALSDLVAGEVNKYFKNIYIQTSSGNLITQVQDVSLSLFEVRVYSAAGALLNTFNPTTTLLGSVFLDHIALTRNELSYHVWFQDGTFSEFRQYSIAAGALEFTTPPVPIFTGGVSVESFTDVDEPDYYYGADDSCPLVVLDGPDVPTNTLIINKQTSPSGLIQVFDFNGAGIDPFSLSDNEQEIINNLIDGIYSIIETLPAGWSVSYNVSNGNPNTAISLSGGVTVTVDVLNTLLTNRSSGIYKLVPAKRNDTLWTDVDAGTTRDVKKPNPFIKTALIGE